MKPILFKLENCEKCKMAEEYLKNVEHESITLPVNVNLWGDEHKSMARGYGVIADLAKTAPVLVVNGEKKCVGALAIRRWARYEGN